MTGRGRTRAGAGRRRLRRLERGDWPSPATVSGLYGTWAAARTDAFPTD